jgi:hypothetical protein
MLLFSDERADLFGVIFDLGLVPFCMLGDLVASGS